MAIDVRSYEPGDLGRLVAFWNRSFADRRNFLAVDEARFARRVVENPAGFEAEGLVLAVDEAAIRGMAHVGRRVDGQAFLALLFVESRLRRRGLGTRLLEAVAERLGGDPMTVDGQCFNPWYGNVQGPFAPFWGTPEGISVALDDRATIEFLEKRGHEVRYEAVTMVRPVATPPLGPTVPTAGVEYLLREGFCPVLGGSPSLGRSFSKTGEHLSWSAIVEGRVVGSVIALSLAEAVPGLWGIYELQVAEAARGRGIGTGLVGRLLATLAGRAVDRCEVLTMPVVSPGAFGLYGRLGFEVDARWAIW